MTLFNSLPMGLGPSEKGRRRAPATVNFARVLKEVVWCLVTEGGISYRRIKLSFGLDDDALDELRRELIGIKRLAADLDGERLVWRLTGAWRAPKPTPCCRGHSRPYRFRCGRLPLPPIATCRAPSGAT